MRRLHIFKELVEVDKGVSKDFEPLVGLGVVHQHYGNVMDVSEISQLRRKVDVTRNEDDRRRGGVGVGKPTETLTQLVVGSILGNGIDMH